MADPALAAGFSNPKVQQAIFDISQNPMNISKYQARRWGFGGGFWWLGGLGGGGWGFEGLRVWGMREGVWRVEG